jgi:hypothetical protein
MRLPGGSLKPNLKPWLRLKVTKQAGKADWLGRLVGQTD